MSEPRSPRAASNSAPAPDPYHSTLDPVEELDAERGGLEEDELDHEGLSEVKIEPGVQPEAEVWPSSPRRSAHQPLFNPEPGFGLDEDDEDAEFAAHFGKPSVAPTHASTSHTTSPPAPRPFGPSSRRSSVPPDFGKQKKKVIPAQSQHDGADWEAMQRSLSDLRRERDELEKTLASTRATLAQDAQKARAAEAQYTQVCTYQAEHNAKVDAFSTRVADVFKRWSAQRDAMLSKIDASQGGTAQTVSAETLQLAVRTADNRFAEIYAAWAKVAEAGDANAQGSSSSSPSPSKKRKASA